MTHKNRLVIGLSALAILIALFPALRRVISSSYQDYTWKNQTEKFVDALQKPFAEDTYGGKTPEETWQMYVEAVKNRDIDLAAKYYDVEHQSRAHYMLQKGISDGLYDYYVNDLTTNPLQRDEKIPDFLKKSNDRAYYFYTYYDTKEKKKINSSVYFYFNSASGVWKILY